MKKILSILLALSIACGSVMLTSCGVDEKEDDDDKSVSDKERDEEEESSESEDEPSEEDNDNNDANAERIEIGEISFVLPEDIEYEASTNYVVYQAENVSFSVETSGKVDSIDNYSEDYFEGSFGDIGTLKDTVYEISTLNGYDTIYYSTTIVASDEENGSEMNMHLVRYTIFTDEDTYGLTAMSYGNGDIDFVGETINSMEIK